MNYRRIIKKLERISNRENLKDEWHIPSISINMDLISEAFQTLYSALQEKEIKDSTFLKSQKAIKNIDYAAKEILTNSSYKKYHNFINKVLLPEAQEMTNAIYSKNISNTSPIIEEAKSIKANMEHIEKQIDREYQNIKKIILTQREAVFINARIEGDHCGLKYLVTQLDKLKNRLMELSTIEKFENELESIKKSISKYYLKVRRTITSKQKELEELDMQTNPTFSLFNLKNKKQSKSPTKAKQPTQSDQSQKQSIEDNEERE